MESSRWDLPYFKSNQTFDSTEKRCSMDNEKLFFADIAYQKLLCYPSEQSGQLAKANLHYIAENDLLFPERMQSMLTCFGRNERPPAEVTFQLSGIDLLISEIQSLQNDSKNCILALFHFGPHRDLLLDLASAGIAFTAPIAGDAYGNFYRQKDQAPEKFASSFELLDVADKKTGRMLIKSAKAGRCLAIYVDGNMGTDGHHVAEGGVLIKFGTATVRVKAGIARLAMQFKAHILPVFCHTEPQGIKTVISGSVIAMDQHGIDHTQVMQELYRQLYKQITMQPEQWEYAACLQRWLHCEDNNEYQIEDEFKEESFWLNFNNVRILHKENNIYLISISRGKAILYPEKIKFYLEDLINGKKIKPKVSELDLFLEMAKMDFIDRGEFSE